jgi:hypothetical protein
MPYRFIRFYQFKPCCINTTPPFFFLEQEPSPYPPCAGAGRRGASPQLRSSGVRVSVANHLSKRRLEFIAMKRTTAQNEGGSL